MIPTLRSYQADGLEFLRSHPRAFLADEMGLGKSAQMLLAAEGRTLIVAPAMVLDGGTWRDEIAKWVPDRAEDFTTVAYSGLNLRQTVETKVAYRETDPETGKQVTKFRIRKSSKIVDVLKPEFRGRWDTIILDEAHYIKGRKTTWTKVLRPLCKKAGRAVLATGTPIPNWAMELFTSLQILYPEEARPGGRFGSYWRWAETWFDTTPEIVYIGGRQKEVAHVGGLLGCTQVCEEKPLNAPCDHYIAFFRANLGDRFLQRLRDDVLTDLPPLTVEKILTPMTSVQGKAYRQMKSEYLAVLEDGALRVAWSSSAHHVMLDKISTGLNILDRDADPMKGSGKLQQLQYDLEQRTRPTLVTAHFQPTVEAACAVARGLGQSAEFIHGGTSRPDRARIVERFKAGRLDVLVGSLETIAEGLTLTAADMVIFLETSFKPSRNQQALRRIHRIGQERPCSALDYITPGTVDEGKRELLKAKTDHQIRTLSVAQMAEIC